MAGKASAVQEHSGDPGPQGRLLRETIRLLAMMHTTDFLCHGPQTSASQRRGEGGGGAVGLTKQTTCCAVLPCKQLAKAHLALRSWRMHQGRRACHGSWHAYLNGSLKSAKPLLNFRGVSRYMHVLASLHACIQCPCTLTRHVWKQWMPVHTVRSCSTLTCALLVPW